MKDVLKVQAPQARKVKSSRRPTIYQHKQTCLRLDASSQDDIDTGMECVLMLLCSDMSLSRAIEHQSTRKTQNCLDDKTKVRRIVR